MYGYWIYGMQRIDIGYIVCYYEWILDIYRVLCMDTGYIYGILCVLILNIWYAMCRYWIYGMLCVDTAYIYGLLCIETGYMVCYM